MASLSLPWIKICGVTRDADLNLLADAGVDAVGFNFVPSSPRCIDRSSAAQLCERARELGLSRVAVVMDLDAAELRELTNSIDVDWIQLHGNERPEQLVDSQAKLAIKAISWSGRKSELALAQIWAETFHSPPATMSTLTGAFLVDAYAPGQGGGTGRTARWDLLQPRPEVFQDLPLVLAGGLNSDNVAEAILATRPDGVDTASGVESSPGIKCPIKVAAFASSARAAFERLKA